MFLAKELLKTMRCVLNDKKIQSMKASHKRQELWDLSLPSFGMRVSKSGQKSFFVMCRENGKQKRVSLGKYPLVSLSEARDLARDKLRLVSQGLPLEEKKPELITVETVFNSFIEIYAKKKNKDWKRTEQRLKLSLIKDCGSIDIRSVTRENINAMLDRIEARGASIQANRAHAGASKFFKWCAERGYIEDSPMRHISKPSKENPRDRVLSDDEICTIWQEAVKMRYPYGPLIQILMMTGQRKSEVSEMCWSEINLKDKVWMIPKERAKNGHSHAVPLSDQLLRILDNLPQFLHSDYVFTTTGKKPISGLGKTKSRLDSATGVKDWIIHDIRRTVASGMARLKVPPHVVEKILNHTSGTFSGVAGVYNRYGYDDEKRAALCVWEDYVLKLTFPLDKSITSD